MATNDYDTDTGQEICPVCKTPMNEHFDQYDVEPAPAGVFEPVTVVLAAAPVFALLFWAAR